jgi:hypothetical protein
MELPNQTSITAKDIRNLEVQNQELRNMIRRLLGTFKGLQVVCQSYSMIKMANECRKIHKEESLRFIEITGEEK